MVPRAHGNAQAVQQGAQVQMMDLPNEETDDAVVRRTEEPHPRNLRQAFASIARERLFVFHDGGESYGADVVQSTRQPRCGHIVGRAGLELVGEAVESGVLEADLADHFAAAHIGWHLLQQRFLAVEHANARGAIDLVAAEGQEVAIQGLHIDGQMGCRLSGIEEHGHLVGVGHADDVSHRVDGAEDIADEGAGEQAGAGREQRLKGIEVQAPFVRDGAHLDNNTRTRLQELPGNDVRMMLHLRQDDFIAIVQESLAEGGCHEIDALCGASGEDDFSRGAGVDKAAHGLARSLMKFRGLLAEVVHAAVDVGVHVQVLIRHGIDDAARFLRRGAVVEVNQRTTVHLAGEDGKILSYLLYIYHFFNRTHL